VSDTGAKLAGEVGAALGHTVARVEVVEGDASRRMFYRLFTPTGTVIAAVYPDGGEKHTAHDVTVQRWGHGHSLPIPAPLGLLGRVSLSEDLGSVDLERALRERGLGVLGAVVEALRAFQTCEWESCPNAPFDAAFFRRELVVFEQFALSPGAAEPAVTEYLDRLCERVAAHPYRLVHRDYHVNNLFLCDGAVRAVDYQDMRGGPDTYDAVSLLRERAGGEHLASDRDWCQHAATALGWTAGWDTRYLECAAQRGLKVIGTFLRLASWGRGGYLAKLPLVRRRAAEALVELGAPRPLVEAALSSAAA
jgi:hypothetical protein